MQKILILEHVSSYMMCTRLHRSDPSFYYLIKIADHFHQYVRPMLQLFVKFVFVQFCRLSNSSLLIMSISSFRKIRRQIASLPSTSLDGPFSARSTPLAATKGSFESASQDCHSLIQISNYRKSAGIRAAGLKI